MKILVLISTLILSMNAFAGGSIGKADALQEIAKTNPAMAKALSKLDLEDSGNAIRVGSHSAFPDEAGMRMMPYVFHTNDGLLTITINSSENFEVAPRQDGEFNP